MTFDEAVSVAETLDSTRTFFIHMSHDSTHQELLERMPPGMAPAWDGLILGLATNSHL
jgi:phosphoribosyl 1,2-cyclic phosphate phosphodiesterase